MFLRFHAVTRRGPVRKAPFAQWKPAVRWPATYPVEVGRCRVDRVAGSAITVGPRIRHEHCEPAPGVPECGQGVCFRNHRVKVAVDVVIRITALGSGWMMMVDRYVAWRQKRRPVRDLNTRDPRSPESRGRPGVPAEYSIVMAPSTSGFHDTVTSPRCSTKGDVYDLRKVSMAGNSVDPGRSVTSKVVAILLTFTNGSLYS